MSFRTYINKHEWLGNNNFPDIIKEELIRQGCPFNKEGFVTKPWPIKDLSGLLKATEQYILKEFDYWSDFANFSSTLEMHRDNQYLTGILQELQDCALIFASVNLIKYAGKENIEGWAVPNIKIKKGKQVLFEYY